MSYPMNVSAHGLGQRLQPYSTAASCLRRFCALAAAFREFWVIHITQPPYTSKWSSVPRPLLPGSPSASLQALQIILPNQKIQSLSNQQPADDSGLYLPIARQPDKKHNLSTVATLHRGRSRKSTQSSERSKLIPTEAWTNNDGNGLGSYQWTAMIQEEADSFGNK